MSNKEELEKELGAKEGSEIKEETNKEVEEEPTCEENSSEENSSEENKDDSSEETEASSEEVQEDESEPAFKIKQLENKIAEQDESIKRLNAEYANYRRRTTEEKSSIGLFANEKIMNELVPVIDNMERALDACEDKESQLYKGIELVYKQLVDSLKKSGLEEIPSEVGTDFDPNLHMAVMQESSEEFEANKILMPLQKGYKLGNKVLRASMVKVSC